MEFFEKVKGNFGFGCMRLPKHEDGSIDLDQFSEMVDTFLTGGLNYFDTARVYHSGASETALKACLASRHSHDEFFFTNKLSGSCFEKREDIRPLIETQLADCGLDYFDLYLMHAQGSSSYPKYQAAHAYEEAMAAKEAGLVRHVGLSFHDTADYLDKILTEHPEVEAVQLQLNYLDWESGAVQGRRCAEVAATHGKPIIVMEPVKGGLLVNLPDNARSALAAAGSGSPASYALRYAATIPGVAMVLSGMGNMDMVRENVATFSPLEPLSDAERAAIAQVVDILNSQNTIPCTGCRYCVDGCPRHILIPDVFACLNAKRAYGDDGAGFYYNTAHTTGGHGKASACVGCGACERICPQHLPIRSLLKDVAAEFEKSE